MLKTGCDKAKIRNDVSFLAVAYDSALSLYRVVYTEYPVGVSELLHLHTYLEKVISKNFFMVNYAHTHIL